MNWSNFFDVSKTIAVKGAIYSDLFTNTHYPYLLVKDAIVDHFRERTGNRPDIEIKSLKTALSKTVKNPYKI